MSYDNEVEYQIAGANSGPAFGFSAAPVFRRRFFPLWLSSYPLCLCLDKLPSVFTTTKQSGDSIGVDLMVMIASTAPDLR